MHARGQGFKSPSVHFIINRSFANLVVRDGFKYDNLDEKHMAGSEAAAIGVWIPLIVGLAPGLVYWLAITAMKSKK